MKRLHSTYIAVDRPVSKLSDVIPGVVCHLGIRTPDSRRQTSRCHWLANRRYPTPLEPRIANTYHLRGYGWLRPGLFLLGTSSVPFSLPLLSGIVISRELPVAPAADSNTNHRWDLVSRADPRCIVVLCSAELRSTTRFHLTGDCNHRRDGGHSVCSGWNTRSSISAYHTKIVFSGYPGDSQRVTNLHQSRASHMHSVP